MGGAILQMEGTKYKSPRQGKAIIFYDFVKGVVWVIVAFVLKLKK
jgi:hypothetical protein